MAFWVGMTLRSSSKYDFKIKVFLSLKQSKRLNLSVYFYQKVIGIKCQCMSIQGENSIDCQNCWKTFCLFKLENTDIPNTKLPPKPLSCFAHYMLFVLICNWQ